MLTVQEGTYLIQCYGTDDLSYREVINKCNEKYPETTISHMVVRKLVCKRTKNRFYKN
jgi:hypothetical protein